MTPVLDGPLGRVAKTLIGTFGAPATLSRRGAPLYDTTTGKSTTAETSSITCSVVWEEFSIREIDGTTIKHGDRKALVSRLAIGYQPNPERDLLTEGGQTYRVLRLLGYPTGAEEAAYSLHVRPVPAGG